MLLMRMRLFLGVFVLLLDPSRYIFAVRTNVKVCGFEQKCTGNETTVDEVNNSCCRPCGCTDLCKERDTCCADKEGLADNDGVIKQQCLPAIYTPEGRQPRGYIKSFFTRAHCPEAFDNLNIKGKCENETTETDSLEDITLVSSEDGTIVYKNKFCGRCHGDKRTVPWTLTVLSECEDLLTNLDPMSLATVTKTLISHCSIIFREPDNLVLKHTICFKMPWITSQCNQTGDWDVYDSKLEELCRRSSDNFYYYKMSPRRADIVYRNVYCYLCNTKAGSALETCQLQNLKFFTKRSFSTLIKRNAWTRSAEREKNSTKCLASQILDTFFNVCRQLYCPTYFLPNNGECIPFLETKLYYLLLVRLILLEPLNRTESINKELVSRYVSIQRKLGLGRCHLCHAYGYMRKDVNDTFPFEIYVMFKLTVAEKCKLEYLVPKLNSIEMTPQNIQIRLNEEIVRFEVFWTNTNWPNEDLYERIELLTKYPLYCPSFTPARASNCAKVKLTKTEYERVLKNHMYANDLLFAPVKGDMNGTMFVCWENYIVNPQSAGVRKKFNCAVSTLTLIIASYRNIFCR